MPTYDYQCQVCNHTFEAFQAMSEDLLKKCPECGKKKLVRLIGTGGAVLFKGAGFYTTDYRSDSYKSAATADKPAECTGTPKDCGVKSCSPKSDSSATK